jgi:hypothetical protein
MLRALVACLGRHDAVKGITRRSMDSRQRTFAIGAIYAASHSGGETLGLGKPSPAQCGLI